MKNKSSNVVDKVEGLKPPFVTKKYSENINSSLANKIDDKISNNEYVFSNRD